MKPVPSVMYVKSLRRVSSFDLVSGIRASCLFGTMLPGLLNMGSRSMISFLFSVFATSALSQVCRTSDAVDLSSRLYPERIANCWPSLFSQDNTVVSLMLSARRVKLVMSYFLSLFSSFGAMCSDGV